MLTRYWPMSSSQVRRLMIWAAILLTWEAAFRWIGWREWIFPAPSHIAHAIREMIVPLISANVTSGLRLVAGFAISVSLGILLGAAMWSWRELDEFLRPLFLGLQTLPSVCWVPLA